MVWFNQRKIYRLCPVCIFLHHQLLHHLHQTKKKLKNKDNKWNNTKKLNQRQTPAAPTTGEGEAEAEEVGDIVTSTGGSRILKIQENLRSSGCRGVDKTYVLFIYIERERDGSNSDSKTDYKYKNKILCFPRIIFTRILTRIIFLKKFSHNKNKGKLGEIARKNTIIH